MAVFLRRIGSTALSEYPTLGKYIYREREQSSSTKTNRMAKNRLKDHTGEKKNQLHVK